jgi:hypothetical protein
LNKTGTIILDNPQLTGKKTGNYLAPVIVESGTIRLRCASDGLLMTRILLISPFRELLIRDFAIVDKGDVKKLQDFIGLTESDYPDIEKILLDKGTVRIMEKGEEIPLLSDREDTGRVREESVNFSPKMALKARTAEELATTARELWDKRMKEVL